MGAPLGVVISVNVLSGFVSALYAAIIAGGVRAEDALLERLPILGGGDRAEDAEDGDRIRVSVRGGDLRGPPRSESVAAWRPPCGMRAGCTRSMRARAGRPHGVRLRATMCRTWQDDGARRHLRRPFVELVPDERSWSAHSNRTIRVRRHHDRGAPHLRACDRGTEVTLCVVGNVPAGIRAEGSSGQALTSTLANLAAFFGVTQRAI